MKRTTPLLIVLIILFLLQACTGTQPGTTAPADPTPTVSGSAAQTPGATGESGTAGAETGAPGNTPSPETADPSETGSTNTPTPTVPAEPSGTTPSPTNTTDPDTPTANTDGVTAAPEPKESNPQSPPSSGTDTQPPDASVPGVSPEETSSAGNAYLLQLPTPPDLAPGTWVEASDSGDLDADGYPEKVYLIRNTMGDLQLRVDPGIAGPIIDGAAPTSITPPTPVTRLILGPEGKGDNLYGPTVSALLLERFSVNDARDIAIGFSTLTYGDSQWAIYQYVPNEDLRLMRLEPYAVDTGTIALRDEDGDGRFERLQYPGHVVRVHRYEENLDGYTPLPVRSFSTETFDWRDPADVARGWLYLLYNRIEPDYSRLMNRPAPDVNAFSMTGYPDIFTPYPSWGGTYAGTAFTDIGAPSWQGLPTAETTILTQESTQASVRLSHVSEFDELRRASIRLTLNKRADGTWSVAQAVSEVAATLCLATDEENEMLLACTPVFLTQQQAAEGYLPLRNALEQASGIVVRRIRQEGTTVFADLTEEMRYFLNQGSTGATMKMNTLARTLLSLPNAKTTRITIAGETEVEMDHYSLRGAYTLNDTHALTQIEDASETAPEMAPETETETESVVLETPKNAQEHAQVVAETLFAALAKEDYEAFAKYADPDHGTTLAIYGFVTEDAPVFDSTRWLTLEIDERIHQFGYYDGSGFPILASSAEWLHLFFVPHRERTEWVRSLDSGGTGTGLATPQETWPEATHVTFHWAGSEIYDGMDWRSITFSLVETPNGWRLLGLVSNQWTV